MKLISQVNGDGDILEAWLRHYLGLGVDSFHVVVHGSRDQNRTLYELVSRYPVHVEDEYAGEFLASEKLRRMEAVRARLGEGWIVWVDSDEFLELPHATLRETIAEMDRLRVDVLPAPFLQRLTGDGSLDTPEHVEDPFRTFPLCSIDLYRRMGVQAARKKFPLFYSTASTELIDGGIHRPPSGARATAPLRGVTHHFKWRGAVLQRLRSRIESSHPCRNESQSFEGYLAAHQGRLPTEGAFPYSRTELFRRGLLGRKPFWKYAVRSVMALVPARSSASR